MSSSSAPAAGANATVQGGQMMFLRPESTALARELTRRLHPDHISSEVALKPVDVKLSDLDGTHYRVEVLEGALGVVRVSMMMPCFKTLERYGVLDHLRRIYADLVVPAIPGADFSVQLRRPLGDADAAAAQIFSISLMRRHAMTVPFRSAFQSTLGGGTAAPPATVCFRPHEPTFILPREDRVTCVYALEFEDATDRAMARVIAQEFVEGQRQITGAPPTAFYDRESSAPTELRPLLRDAPAPTEAFVGYLSITLFPRNFDKEAKAEATLTQMTLLRSYLDYHLKAAKSYLHGRMRTRVEGWLQVLNRAHPESPHAEKEKKRQDGKTFVRKV